MHSHVPLLPLPRTGGVQTHVLFMWLVAEQVVSQTSSLRVSQESPVEVPAAQAAIPASTPPSGRRSSSGRWPKG